MPYVDQFDQLRRAQDLGRAVRNIRTMVVFSDGLVVCAVGVDGGYNLPLLFGLDALLRPVLLVVRMAGQILVRGNRAEQIRRTARAMGQGGTAEAFARSRRKAVAIPFSEVRMIELNDTQIGRQLTVCTVPSGAPRELFYCYLGDLPADRARRVLGPLVGARLKIDTATG
jgi:hypothetical protein